MENKIASSSSMHPMLWIAAIAVTLFSFVGIASLTGLLPGKSATEPPPAASVGTLAPPYTPPAPVPAPAQAVAATPATSIAEANPAAASTPAAVPHKPVKKKVAAAGTARNQSSQLPPAGAGVPPDYAPTSPSVAAAPPAPPPCANCGVIADIRQIAHEGKGTGLGAVAGGVLGGVLGNQVGKGNGRTLATIAGAVGGGFLGNKVEKSRHETTAYQISIRMEDNTTQVIEATTTPPWRIGDQVRLVDGAIISR